MRHECYFCHINTIEELIKKFKLEREIADLFAPAACEILFKNHEKENGLFRFI